MRGALLHELPWPDGDRLIRIDGLRERVPGDGGVSWPTFLDLSERLEGVQRLAAYQGSEGVWIGDGVTEVWRGTSMSRDLLAVLGVPPLLGSWYGPDEWALGEMSIYLSHDLWERRFGADSAIVGRTIPFSEGSWLVRGVMPRGVGLPDVGAASCGRSTPGCRSAAPPPSRSSSATRRSRHASAP